MNQPWRNSKTKQLSKAFLLPKITKEAAAFCRDLMTEAEINEFSGRFAVAVELNAGKRQRQVSQETEVSIATVSKANHQGPHQRG